MRKIFLVPFVLAISVQLSGQSLSTSDSIHFYESHKTPRKGYVVPIILIAAGFVATTDNEIFDDWETREIRNEVASGFRIHADDYLEFSPIVAVYALNAFGVKGTHDLANRTALLIKSELLVNGIVFPVKALTGVLRPDGTTKDAFPSGHTAQVFMAATFLHKEFGRDHPLYSVLAYATATGVGVLRILNDRHWLSDVLVGAGVGILSTNLVYLTHQDKWGKHPTKYRATASPSFDHGSAGMYLRISFL